MPLKGRRKTFAGMKITKTGGIALQRIRPLARRAPPVSAAKAAERLVCRSLGITRDGEDVTAATLETFAEMFKEQLTPEVIGAMRVFFKLDDDDANAAEEALIGHGGEMAADAMEDQAGLGSQSAIA